MADKKTIALNERDSAAMLQQCGVNMVPCALLERGTRRPLPLLPRAWASPWP